jgi:hypothetical protein
MKSFRDMAKTSAEKKMKMYGAKENEVSSHIKNAEKYGNGGCIKKADGGSVGSDMDEMDGEMDKPRMDRGGKKPSTTVNIIVGGKSGPDAGAMPPPMPMAGPPPPSPMPPPGGPMPPMRAKGGRVHLTGGSESGIGRLEKNHKK